MHVLADTLDDLMHSVIEQIQAHGEGISPTKGWAAELTGVLLELADPRARLSHTETRGKPFSCLGKICWYLAKSNDVEFISYYIPRYEEFADGSEVFGGYGPRLFNWVGVNQLANVIEILKKNSVSRKAVVQLFDADDIVRKHADVPCTCTLQFMIRTGRLHLLTNMRSNDAFLGLPHDVFAFTMLQEIVARTLSVELGTYKHVVGSLHLYAKDMTKASRFLKEGWQPTDFRMPPMPDGDPWPAINLLLEAESAIRITGSFDESKLDGVDPYWADLIRLLQVFGCRKKRNWEKIKVIRERMTWNVYRPFIDNLLVHGNRGGVTLG